MSPPLLTALVLFFFMAWWLGDLYAGGRYQCPSCGARDQDRHSPDCAWNQP